MAELIARPKIELRVQISLSEEEARALDALSGYAQNEFIKQFYTFLGEHYMKPHEEGLRSFLQSCRDLLPGILGKADDARSVFTGEKKAIHKDVK